MDGFNGLSGVRSVGFIPNSDPTYDRIQRLGGLLRDLNERKRTRQTQAQEEAQAEAQAMLQIAEQYWGPGEWAKHSETVKQSLMDAGYDAQMVDFLIQARTRAATDAQAPAEAKRLFSESFAENMGAPGVTPLEAYQGALSRLTSESPGSLFMIQDELKGLPDILGAPGEAEAMAAERNPEGKAKEWTDIARILGPAAATEHIRQGIVPKYSKEQLAFLAAQGNPTAQRAQEMLRENSLDTKLPTLASLALQAANGSESARKALDIYKGLSDRGEGDGGPTPTPLSADQKKDILAFEKSMPALERLRQLSAQVNTLRGPAARAAGVGKRGMAAANLDDATALYESTLRGFTPLFARALGHTGVLTEIDVERTQSLFPAVGDSASVAQAKLDGVESLIQEVRQRSAEAFTDPTEGNPQGDVSDLDSMINSWPVKSEGITEWATSQYEKHVSAGADPAKVLEAIQAAYEAKYGGG